MVRAVLSTAILVAAASPAVGLSQQTTTPPVAAPAQLAANDKVRCKRYVETGSLAKIRKECHTEEEWRRLAEDGQRGARAIVSGVNTALRRD
jgi:hypothetical protein